MLTGHMDKLVDMLVKQTIVENKKTDMHSNLYGQQVDICQT